MFARTLTSLSFAVGWRKKATHRARTAKTDRRVWVRYPCEVAATCQPASPPDSQRLAGRVFDISRGGVSLLLSAPVPIGAFLSIELPAGRSSSTSTVLAYVVRVTPQNDSEWSVGCTFASELGDDDLEPFGARRIKPESDDQRNWVRYPCQARASYQPVKQAGQELTAVRVRNISANGIALVVDQPVELGAMLNLDLTDAAGHFHLQMLACVVRINRSSAPEWVLGCNLIRELTCDELRSLLQEAVQTDGAAKAFHADR